jgi:acyl-CoA dehydrogenase
MELKMQSLVLVIVAAVVLTLALPPLRRNLVSRHVLKWFRSVLPPMSSTEKAAIDAGTTWWDAEVFSGKPDWHKLLRVEPSALSDGEQAFLDGPVEELCKMLDDWAINNELNDLPESVWEFLKVKRFFGMIIPKAHGGLEFSPRGQSEVVMKVATRSPAAAITVMVPNSLGPAELLLHYGTDAQQSHYLPRLAAGEEIPAFALTSTHAGSDAGAMPDSGVVCRGTYNGEETLGFRVSWDKRYITLAPVCTVLGLAFKAFDPDGLLGERQNLGITCALIPAQTPGVSTGPRHEPGSAFLNGTTSGTDVFVPMEWVIGGQQQIGEGWKMLMNCLSVGRAISLPALGTAAGKLTSRSTGAYARVRKQFRTPIGKFEGVGEALGRIAGLTYRMDASRLLAASALADGEKPAVISAILKYHNTEGLRQVINDAVDVHAGRAICGGPTNYLRSTYDIAPVAITVEGANILTRSMIIFGQGAIRCHPFVLGEMTAAADTDERAGLAEFDRLLFRHIRYTVMNAIRALSHGLSGARFASSPRAGELGYYYRQLTRMSAAFSFLADTALLTLGGELKRRESLSARFGDVLSHLYMASAVLKRFEDDGAPYADRPFVDWAVSDSLAIIQERLLAILDNFPSRFLGKLLRVLTFPLGRPYRGPSDDVTQRLAGLLLSPSDSRDRLTRGMFVPKGEGVGLLDALLEQADDIEPVVRAAAKHAGSETRLWTDEEAIARAKDDGAVTDIEAAKLTDYRKQLLAAIAVEAFESQAGGNTARIGESA